MQPYVEYMNWARQSMDENVHDTPSYTTFLTRVYNCTRARFSSPGFHEVSYSPVEFYYNLRDHGCFTWTEPQIVVVFVVLWTILRCVVSRKVSRPLANYLQLLPVNAQKFPESVWKLFFYLSTWLTIIYVLFRGNYDFFQRPLTIWEDWKPSMVIPDDIYWVYMVEFSFYLHSVYATLFMDAWRKDSMVMLFHHFLTMSLLGFSYAARYHKVGMLVLFMHDVTDICLEFTKCNVYLKNRGGKHYALHEHLSTIGFLFFAGTWYLFRLYWFPLKVLYTSTYGVDLFGPRPDTMQFFLFFNASLWILQMLNIYWFYFILNFLYKVATGQMKEVDDVREKEVEEKFTKKPSKSMANGHKYENGTNCHATSLNKNKSGDSVKSNGLKHAMKTD